MKVVDGHLTSPVRVDADLFRPVLLSPAPQQDAELADLIEQDGRDRLDRGLACDLDRYYSVVPDLIAKPISLDAAIDISLRSIAIADGCSSPQERHAECLLKSYPELAGPIRLAALLNNQLVSTSGMGASGKNRRNRVFPRRIGPALEDGNARYELLRPLGRGSSGTVCEAIDHLLSDSGHSAKVAVKLIPVDPATAQRQTAEATKARRIEHSGVVRVLDRGLTDDGELYLVYELVSGGDLQAWFDERGKSIAPSRAAELLAGIASGVQAAHSAGLVHCDLKPSNILMTNQGRPLVSDFGVSAMTDPFPGMAGESFGGVPIGNLAFAAPEQIRRSAMFASPLVDVYALGGLLYYLLSGQLPNGSTPEEVARTHSPAEGRRVPPSVRAIAPVVDERLARVCGRAMHPRPEERYPTAGELAADLAAWLEKRPIAWMKDSLSYRVGLWIRRSPVAATFAACSIAVLLVGGFTTGFFANRASTATQYASATDRTLQTGNEVFTEFYKLLDSPEGQKMTNDELMAALIALMNKVQPHPNRLQQPAKPKAQPSQASPPVQQ